MKTGNPSEPSATAVVVNDDVTQINLLTALLHKDGMKVLPFLDAEAALKAMVQNGPPALIITDLYMPGLDGWRFCRLLRSPEYQAFNQVPILVISATFSGDESVSITADLGADAFLNSPIDAGQFIKHVHTLLDGKRSQQQLRVLIVEDSRTLSGILKKAFDAHGYWTETTLTLKAAIAAFGKSPWNVVVIDYHLPDGKGDELLHDFRAKQPDCVCLMMTTDPAPELALSWMKKGAAAYLRKPFAPEYLIELCVKTRRERALLRVQDLLEMRTRELQKSEEQYRLLVENARDMVFRTDVNGHFTFANPAALRFAGYEKEDIIGRQYTILLRPDSRDAALRFFGHQLIKGIPNTYSEYPVLTKDGREFWVGQNAQLVVEGDTVSGFQIVSRDITARKQAEDALRDSEESHKRMIANISDVIAIMDKDGKLKYKSPNIVKWFGWQPEDLVGTDGWLTVHPDDLERIQKEFNTLIHKHNSVKTVEYRYKCKDGSYKLIALTAVNLTNDPIISGVLMNYRDITESKRAEAEKAAIEAQNRQLQKSESLGRMAGAIAHHFNNQLGVVIGNLEMAIDELPQDARHANSLNAAMRAAVKSAEMSGLMLTYLGQSFDEREPLDLSEACQGGLPILRAFMPGNVLLKTDLPSPGPVISANANQIQQVLTNLVTNAWEVVNDDGGSVHLRVKTVSPEKIPSFHRFPGDWQPQDTAYACLEVKDAGCGIADKDIEKLFDPFFSTKFTGRGMGLPVVIGIVKAHGGVIAVESEPGRGSIFRAFFPVTGEEVFKQPEKAVQPSTIMPPAGGGTVLLIEDEETLREMAAAMLKRLGFAVLEAKDGVDAVEIFRQHQDEIRFVLSDLTMPRLNGWETLTALRKIKPGVPVILASGYDKAHVMSGDHPELPQVFLGKPYRIKELSDAISHALESRK